MPCATANTSILQPGNQSELALRLAFMRRSCPSPLGVNRVGLAVNPRLPLYPDEQTSLPSDGMSQRCHNRHSGFHRANARAADVSSTLEALQVGGATSPRAIGAARASARRNNPSRNALVKFKSAREVLRMTGAGEPSGANAPTVLARATETVQKATEAVKLPIGHERANQ
jgi:hypothetical protein